MRSEADEMASLI